MVTATTSVPAPAPAPRSGRGLMLFAAALLGGMALAWQLRQLLLLIYASVLFAIVVQPAIEAVERLRLGRWRPGRPLAITTVLLGALLGVLLVLGVVLPPLLSEIGNLVTLWPQETQTLLGLIQRIPGLHHVNPGDLAAEVTLAGRWTLGMAQQAAASVADFFTVLLLTVFLIAGGPEAAAWCLRLVPPGPRPRLAATLDRAQRRMRGWIVGQAGIALVLFGLSLTLFGVLHLRDFYVLALLSGLLSFVPVLGAITAATLCGVAAAMDSWGKLVVVLAFFAVYELFENAYLTPRIMRNAVDVPGLAIIIALAVGGTLGGVLGAALAVPSAALVAELVNEYALFPG